MEAQILPSPWQFNCDLEVNFESDEKASIVCAALNVDKELQPDKVKRVMSVTNGKLAVKRFYISVGVLCYSMHHHFAIQNHQMNLAKRHFEAVEARFLRASFSAFVDVLTLATKTIEEFGPGVEL